MTDPYPAKEETLDHLFSTTRALYRNINMADSGSGSDVISSNHTSSLQCGGLRARGFHKRSTFGRPLISIITVVYNGESQIEDTIKSVIGQSYNNVEYIVIDGSSADKTMEIIHQYEHAIDYWLSEKDNGIYEAMNKAIDLSEGKWINFMNSGDKFVDIDILRRMAASLCQTGNTKIFYGDHIVDYGSYKIQNRAGQLFNLWKGSQFCHQSAFISRDFHRRTKYNARNRISADYEFFFNAWTAGEKFKYLGETVSIYSAGGLSDKQRLRSILSRLGVIKSVRQVSFREYAYYAFLIARVGIVKFFKFVLNPKFVRLLRQGKGPLVS